MSRKFFDYFVKFESKGDMELNKELNKGLEIDVERSQKFFQEKIIPHKVKIRNCRIIIKDINPDNCKKSMEIVGLTELNSSDLNLNNSTENSLNMSSFIRKFNINLKDMKDEYLDLEALYLNNLKSEQEIQIKPEILPKYPQDQLLEADKFNSPVNLAASTSKRKRYSKNEKFLHYLQDISANLTDVSTENIVEDFEIKPRKSKKLKFRLSGCKRINRKSLNINDTKIKNDNENESQKLKSSEAKTFVKLESEIKKKKKHKIGPLKTRKKIEKNKVQQKVSEGSCTSNKEKSSSEHFKMELNDPDINGVTFLDNDSGSKKNESLLVRLPSNSVNSSSDEIENQSFSDSASENCTNKSTDAQDTQYHIISQNEAYKTPFDVSQIHKILTVYPEDLELEECSVQLEDIMTRRLRKYDSDESVKIDSKNFEKIKEIQEKIAKFREDRTTNSYINFNHSALFFTKYDKKKMKKQIDVKLEDPVKHGKEGTENQLKIYKNEAIKAELQKIEDNNEETVKYEPEKQLLIVLSPIKIIVKQSSDSESESSDKKDSGVQKNGEIFPNSQKVLENLLETSPNYQRVDMSEEIEEHPKDEPEKKLLIALPLEKATLTETNSHKSSNSDKVPSNVQKVDKFFTKIQKVSANSQNKENNPVSEGETPKNFNPTKLEILSNFKKLGYKQFECKRCKKIIMTYSFLKEHIRRHETKKPRCEDCYKSFISSYTYKKHICEATCKFCKICKKTFSFTQTFRLHMKNLHPELLNGKFLECDLCAEKYFQIHKIRKHMEQKHLKPYGEFTCDYDGKKFRRRPDLYNHMLNHFSKIVECKICHRKLKEKSLKLHALIMHNTETFKCNKCPKSFKSLAYLNLHNKYHNKEFPCDICNKRFGNNFELARHVRDFHTNPKSYCCKICNKKFYTSYVLKSHEKIHIKNRQKRINCKKCSFGTDNLTAFRKHMKYHEKLDAKILKMKNPVQCALCFSYCRDEHALSSHMSNVHPKKSYTCDVCGAMLKIKYNFLRHLKVIHGFQILNF